MLRKPKKSWTPAHWASWKPLGLGEQYPNNYWEVFRAGSTETISPMLGISEGNVLQDPKRRSPEVAIPDYNTLIQLENSKL